MQPLKERSANPAGDEFKVAVTVNECHRRLGFDANVVGSVFCTSKLWLGWYRQW